MHSGQRHPQPPSARGLSHLLTKHEPAGPKNRECRLQVTRIFSILWLAAASDKTHPGLPFTPLGGVHATTDSKLRHATAGFERGERRHRRGDARTAMPFIESSSKTRTPAETTLTAPRRSAPRNHLRDGEAGGWRRVCGTLWTREKGRGERLGRKGKEGAFAGRSGAWGGGERDPGARGGWKR